MFDTIKELDEFYNSLPECPACGSPLVWEVDGVLRCDDCGADCTPQEGEEAVP